MKLSECLENTKRTNANNLRPIHLVSLALAENDVKDLGAIDEYITEKDTDIIEIQKARNEDNIYSKYQFTDMKQKAKNDELQPSLSSLMIEQQKTLILPASLELNKAQGFQNQAAQVSSYTSFTRNLIKSSGIYALGSIASPLVSLVLSPFLAHNLSHIEYGVLAILNTVISLAAGITQLGLKNAFFRAYNYDYKSQNDKLRTLSTAVTLLLLSSISFAVVIMIIAPWLSMLLFNSPAFSIPLEITALVVLVQNLTVPGLAWLRAENHATRYTLLSILNLLTTLVGTIVLMKIFNLGVTGALLATGGGYASIMIFTLPVIVIRAGLRPRADIIQNLLSFGIPLVSSFVSYWILQLSDRFLLSRLGSLSQTASYAVAYSLGGVIGTVIYAPFSLAWPTAMFAIAKRKDAGRLFGLVFRWYSIVLLFTAFALSLCAIDLLNMLFPVSYRVATPIIPIIALSIMFYSVYDMFMIGVGILRKTWLAFIFITIAALSNVGLNFILIPQFGSIGAALSTLLAYILLDLVAFVVNQKIYPIPFGMGTFLIAILGGVSFYIGCSLLVRMDGGHETNVIYVSSIVLYGGYLLLIGILTSLTTKNKKQLAMEDSLK